jgi:hypothetical protein
MPDAVCQVMTLLCGLVTPLPIGTNLGLLHLLWMLVSGRLLGARGAVFAGLSAALPGLPTEAVAARGGQLGGLVQAEPGGQFRPPPDEQLQPLQPP